MDGNDAGHDRDGDAARAHAVDVAEVHLVVEEELADGARGAGVDLRLQHVDIGLDRGRFRMLLGIAGDRDLERRDGLDAAHEIGGVDVAAGRRLIALADAARRVAAQGHDVADAQIPIIADDVVELGLGRGDASQMRGRLQRALAQHARDGRVRALARRAAGAIGHRDIARTKRLEPPDRAPQRLLHRRRLGREELERDVDGAAPEDAALGFGARKHYAATSTWGGFLFLVTAAGFSPSQSDTVSVPAACLGASSRKRSTLRPAPSSQRSS